MTAIYNVLYEYLSPIFGYIMLGIYKLVGGFGGYGFALILFTILARCLMLPTAVSQQKGMAKQQRLHVSLRHWFILRFAVYSSISFISSVSLSSRPLRYKYPISVSSPVAVR